MHINFLLATCLAAVVLAGCGGGEDGSSSETFTADSGVVQKGPLLRGSLVTVNSLNSTLMAPTGSSYAFEVVNDFGTFSPASTAFNSSVVEATALGYYFNELTGQRSTDMVMLRGIANLTTTADRSLNLNVLTDLARGRIRNLVTRPTNKLTVANARIQAQREVLAALYIYNTTDLMNGGTNASGLMELDLSKARVPDQILATVSGLITQIGQSGGNIMYFLSQFEADIADDGLLNNSLSFSPSVREQINAASIALNFGTVAGNLNSFYKTTSYTGPNLSQWNDSSGGVDQVIDKFKFNSVGVVGTEVRSPIYVAGSDDIGQCMSVSAGTLYLGAAAVQTKTIKVSALNNFTIGLLPTVAGDMTGYIQRSAPSASGVCPAVLPTTGLTRIVQYKVTSLASVGGAITGLRTGKSITLTNNGGDALTRTANGAFTFAAKLVAGASYSVAVSSQPSGQTCTVAKGSGAITGGNVADVAISCSGPILGGNIEWTRNVAAAGKVSCNRPAIVAGDEDDYYLAGVTFSSIGGQQVLGGKDVFVAKYNSLGVLNWARIVGTAQDDFVGQITRDASGNLLLSTTSGLYKLSASGAVMFVLQGNFEAARVDTAGNIYTVGTLPNGDWALQKFSSNGSNVWTSLLAGQPAPRYFDLQLDQEAIYLIGASSGPFEDGIKHVKKFDLNGNSTWTTLIQEGRQSNFTHTGWQLSRIFLNQAGELLITGGGGKSALANSATGGLLIVMDKNGLVKSRSLVFEFSGSDGGPIFGHGAGALVELNGAYNIISFPSYLGISSMVVLDGGYGKLSQVQLPSGRYYNGASDAVATRTGALLVTGSTGMEFDGNNCSIYIMRFR